MSTPQSSEQKFTGAQLKKRWQPALAAAAQARGLPHGSSWAAAIDGEVIVSAVSPIPLARPGMPRTAMWKMTARPMSLDPLLWRALHWEHAVGGQAKQVRIRVMGPFSVDGLDVGYRQPVIDGTENELREQAALVVDALVTTAARLRSEQFDVAAYRAALEAKCRERPELPHLFRVGRVTAAIALGDLDGARKIIDQVFAEGDGHGTFVIGDTSIWQLLSADLIASSGVFARGS
ncbi:hypothetical protein BH11ACT3_BH11ACT3_07900 [soil metagenome]